MSRIALAGLLLVAAAPATAAERNFTLSGFDAVGSAGSFDVVVTTGKGYSVKAVGTQRDLDRLKIEVADRRLRIGTEGRGWFDWSKSEPVKVYVSLPALNAASVAGSGDMTVDRVKGEAFKGSVAGSGNLKIGNLDVKAPTFSVAGSGNASAAGRCNALKVSVAGSGDLELADLKCETLDASIAGSGNVRAFATKLVTGGLAGSGDLTVNGGAKCQLRAAGSSKVSCG